MDFLAERVKASGLAPLNPRGIVDASAGVRFAANFGPAIALLGETLLDLILAISVVQDMENIFGILALMTAVLALPFNVYVLGSSNNDLSSWAETSGRETFAMVLLTDMSDSLFINAVGGNLSFASLVAAFIPLMVPLAELSIALCCKRDHKSSHLVLVQSVCSAFFFF